MSRSSSSREAILVRPPRVSGISISNVADHSCSSKYCFPEGIDDALTEVGCEEALRKNSNCASEELLLIFYE